MYTHLEWLTYEHTVPKIQLVFLTIQITEIINSPSHLVKGIKTDIYGGEGVGTTLAASLLI